MGLKMPNWSPLKGATGLHIGIKMSNRAIIAQEPSGLKTTTVKDDL